MNKLRELHFFLAGFLFCSVMMRLSGKVSGEDIAFPAALLFLAILNLIVISKQQPDEVK